MSSFFTSNAQALQKLKKLRLEFKDFGTASIMKEYIRNIYSMADSCELARNAFTLWCEKAEVTGISCLKKMAKTIRKRMEGLISFWKHSAITNASQEGFNNKIGWLTRQAYGYRDEIYLHLKIHDLPIFKPENRSRKTQFREEPLIFRFVETND